MAKGPRGQRRSGDFAQRAHHVFQIAIGEEKEDVPSRKRNSGLAGAAARTKALSPARRKKIARKAAEARWS